MKIKLIVDTDPGVDDALALFMLSQSKTVDIKLLVSACGNRGIIQTTKNLCYLANYFGINKKVVAGASKPLKRKLEDAKNIHGKIGLGDFVYTQKHFNYSKDYINEIKSVLDQNNNVYYLCLGPMTNLANFLIKYPSYIKKIKSIVFMGGVKDQIIVGNIYKEFNIGCDPEACEKVLEFAKQTKLVAIPSELGHFACLSPEDVKRISKLNDLGATFSIMFKSYKDRCVPINFVATHDACVVSYFINKKILKFVKAKLEVEYFDEIQTGCLVNNINTKKTNALLAVDINKDKFIEMLYHFIKSYRK